ncbi:MAG: hypothetical protein QM809_16150 [Gordonia sp. (in: high G+C Gram-positive bacteria)]|uniref:hypothetical protein n=1 Tax=Gordonia sp. (in: high G+C Gram-positive bacteria) TaxID=84139 RepID=UPI0039E5212F
MAIEHDVDRIEDGTDYLAAFTVSLPSGKELQRIGYVPADTGELKRELDKTLQRPEFAEALKGLKMHMKVEFKQYRELRIYNVMHGHGIFSVPDISETFVPEGGRKPRTKDWFFIRAVDVTLQRMFGEYSQRGNPAVVLSQVVPQAEDPWGRTVAAQIKAVAAYQSKFGDQHDEKRHTILQVADDPEQIRTGNSSFSIGLQGKKDPGVRLGKFFQSDIDYMIDSEIVDRVRDTPESFAVYVKSDDAVDLAEFMNGLADAKAERRIAKAAARLAGQIRYPAHTTNALLHYGLDSPESANDNSWFPMDETDREVFEAVVSATNEICDARRREHRALGLRCLVRHIIEKVDQVLTETAHEAPPLEEKISTDSEPSADDYIADDIYGIVDDYFTDEPTGFDGLPEQELSEYVVNAEPIKATLVRRTRKVTTPEPAPEVEPEPETELPPLNRRKKRRHRSQDAIDARLAEINSGPHKPRKRRHRREDTPVRGQGTVDRNQSGHADRDDDGPKIRYLRTEEEKAEFARRRTQSTNKAESIEQFRLGNDF